MIDLKGTISAKIDDIHSELENNYKQGDEHWAEDDVLFPIITKFVESIPHENLLEIGSGKGYLTRRLAEFVPRVVALDVSETALKEAHDKISPEYLNRVNLVTGSFENFSGTDFDIIVASEVLYYMKNRSNALNKIKTSTKYLVTSNFIFSAKEIGFGSIIYEILMRLKFKRIKTKIIFSLKPLNLQLVSIWRVK